MRIVSIHECPIDATLARSVVDGSGRILLAEGSIVTLKAREVLHARAVPALLIEDGDLDDIVPPELVPAELHARAVTALFNAVGELLQLVREFRFKPLRAIQREVRSADFARRVLQAGAIRALEPVARALLEELSFRLPIDGALSSLMPVSSVHRTVDSALLAAALARKAGLEPERQRQLVLGMLLRDIGMMFVEPETLETAARPSDAAWNRIKHHPTLGFLLAHVIAPNDVFAQSVVMQHHERQDGNGYPRGLKGTNRLHRKRDQGLRDAGLSLEGEIATLVDVYTAVTAHRPYGSALAADAGAREVLALAGSGLNENLARLFASSVAWYPILARVRVRAGNYEGCTGYAVHSDAERPWRPTVRLLEGADGLPMPALDFALSESAVEIEGLPPPEPDGTAGGRWILADEVERIMHSRPGQIIDALGEPAAID